MEQLYPYSTICEQNMFVVIHIYRARANPLLFCDLQDTLPESCKIEMSIYQPIFTNTNDIKG